MTERKFIGLSPHVGVLTSDMDPFPITICGMAFSIDEADKIRKALAKAVSIAMKTLEVAP